MVIVKQAAQGFPVHLRAHVGYLHLDFKAHTGKQARRKLKRFLRLQFISDLTAWGYGRIRWVRQQTYFTPKPARVWSPRFRILKGLLPNPTPQERQLVMTALLHDLIDTATHPSKLGRSIIISDSYVQWLYVQHHPAKDHPANPDLQLLQEADGRTAAMPASFRSQRGAESWLPWTPVRSPTSGRRPLTTLFITSIRRFIIPKS